MPALTCTPHLFVSLPFPSPNLFYKTINHIIHHDSFAMALIYSASISEHDTGFSSSLGNSTSCHRISKNSCDFMFRSSSQDVSLRDDLISTALDHSLHSLGQALLSQEMKRSENKEKSDRKQSRRKKQKTIKDRGESEVKAYWTDRGITWGGAETHWAEWIWSLSGCSSCTMCLPPYPTHTEREREGQKQTTLSTRKCILVNLHVSNIQLKH